MTRIKTFAADNKFRFNCPVFGAEVAIADCLSLRETVARGGRPEERRGCQACMRASKCPIPRLIQVTARTGEDNYHASEPRVGQLRPDLLDFIAPIVVPEHMLNEHGVPPTEREIILALNENIAAGRRGKAKALPKVQLEDVPKRRAAAAAPDADERAAAAGDMGAAIKKAAAKEAAKPTPAPVPEKSLQKAAGGDSPAKAQSPRPTPPSPPAANVANSSGSDLAISPRKAPSLLELARQKRAAQAQAQA